MDQALDPAHPEAEASQPRDPQLDALLGLARQLSRLPKAPSPSAAFVGALAQRLALSQASPSALGAPASTARPVVTSGAGAIDVAAGARTASPSGSTLSLDLLAQSLATLPKAPAPDADFRVQLAARLSQLPDPRSIAATATTAATQQTQTPAAVQPTQEVLQRLDERLAALTEGRAPSQATVQAGLDDELGTLLDLAAGLRALPATPSPAPAFRQDLAQTLRQAPWPRSLPQPVRRAPWTWLAAFWRSTAATAAAAAAILLFLARGHLPSSGGLPALAPEPAPAPISRLVDRGPALLGTAPLRRQDPALASAVGEGPAAEEARPPAPAPIIDGPRTVARLAPAPAAVPEFGLLAQAPSPAPDALPAASEVEEDPEEEERDDEDARQGRGAQPEVRPQPTQAAPEQPPASPQASEPPPATVQPATPAPIVPSPTAPVIPANQPPRILGLACTPDQVEEAGSAECTVEVEDDGGKTGLSYTWSLQGVGPELSGTQDSRVTFTASGNGGGLSWLGEFVILVLVRDAEGLEVQGRTLVTIRPAQP